MRTRIPWGLGLYKHLQTRLNQFIKRPQGRIIYQITGEIREAMIGPQRFIQVQLRKPDGATVWVSTRDFNKMEPLDG